MNVYHNDMFGKDPFTDYIITGGTETLSSVYGAPISCPASRQSLSEASQQEFEWSAYFRVWHNVPSESI